MNARCANRMVPALVLLGAIAFATAGIAAETSPAVLKPRVAAKAMAGSTAIPPTKKPTTARTLDPIHIAGELDVPEVLFITARDQRRIVDFQHGRYLRTSRQLARETPLPTRIVVNRVPRTPSEEAK